MEFSADSLFSQQSWWLKQKTDCRNTKKRKKKKKMKNIKN